MTKIVVPDIDSGYNLTQINVALQALATELNGKVLYRDNPTGEPNSMDNNLDMNNFQILNLPAPATQNSPARLRDVQAVTVGLAPASLVPFTPAGTIAATTVQAAIEEVATESQAIAVDLASSATGKGDALVATKRNATGSIARTQHQENEDRPFYITEFGASSSATAAVNTAAIHAAMSAAMNRFSGGDNFYAGGPGQPYDINFAAVDRRAGKIVIPAGRYKVLPNTFSSLDNARAPFVGFVFEGEHHSASVLELETGGVESWFYNNGAVGTRRYQKLLFRNLGFTSDNYRYGNVMKMYSDGGPKQPRFENCNFEFLQKFLWTLGTGNADLVKVVNCTGLFYGDILTLDNDQSVQHDYIGTDFGTYGHVVRVKTNGGGNVNFINGSMDFIWHEDFSPPGGNFFFIHDSDANIGQGNCTFTFSKLRVEIEAYKRSAGNPPLGLVKTTDQPNAAFPQITFSEVNFVNGKTYTINAGGDIVSSEWRRITALDVHPRKVVIFDRCVLLKNFFYNITGSRDTGSPNAGALVDVIDCFDGVTSELPSGDSALENIHSRVTYSGSAGRFMTRGMSEHTTGSSFTRKLLDADPNWRKSFGREPGCIKKITSVKHQDNGWPFAGNSGNDYYIDLPPNFYALRIYIDKPASGSVTNAYQVHIGNGDKSVILGSSTLAQFKDRHTITLTDLDLSAYSRLRIWATGTGTDFLSGGVAYIEHT